MAARFVPPSVNALRRRGAGIAAVDAFHSSPWSWGRSGNTTRAGAPPASGADRRVIVDWAGGPPPGSGSAEAPPPAPPPDPVSYGQQATITQLENQRAGLSGIYNPQRQGLYTEGARGLTDQGYFDTAQAQANEADPASGAVTYRLVTGADGRVYRQAFQQSASAFNSRGAFDSSERMRTQVDQRVGLNNARDAILRSLANNQDDITRQQTADYTTLSGQIGQAQGDYADWKAGQVVPPPPPASEAVTSTPTPTGQARWRQKPRGFQTVLRNGWYYRV